MLSISTMLNWSRVMIGLGDSASATATTGLISGTGTWTLAIPDAKRGRDDVDHLLIAEDFRAADFDGRLVVALVRCYQASSDVFHGYRLKLRFAVSRDGYQR